MNWLFSGLEVDELPAGYAHLDEALDSLLATHSSAAPDSPPANALHAAGYGVTTDGTIRRSALVEDLAALDQQLTTWDPHRDTDPAANPAAHDAGENKQSLSDACVARSWA